jgi:hypothetical protein
MAVFYIHRGNEGVVYSLDAVCFYDAITKTYGGEIPGAARRYTYLVNDERNSTLKRVYLLCGERYVVERQRRS